MIYDVQINRLGLSALFELQGQQSDISAWAAPALPAFPETPNTRSETDAAQLCWLGAETWLLRAPLAHETALSDALKPETAPDDISIVCVSDTLTFWQITGPEADQILAIASPLDVHPRVFAEHAVTWSEMFGQRALILRVPEGFEIAVDRSYGAMFEDYFARITS